MPRSSSSCPAIAGKGDHPAQQGGGRGAGLNANAGDTRKLSAPTLFALRRQPCGESCAPSTTVRSLRELQWSPFPRYRGGGKCFRISLHPDRFTLHIKGRRSADRRNCPRSTPRKQMSPSVRARGVGALTGAHAYRRSAAALVAANERRRSASARTSWDLASSGVTRIWPVHSVQRVAPQYRS